MFMDEYSKVNSPGYRVVYADLLIYDLMTFVITRDYPPSCAAARCVELVLRLQLSVSLQSGRFSAHLFALVCPERRCSLPGRVPPGPLAQLDGVLGGGDRGTLLRRRARG